MRKGAGANQPSILTQFKQVARSGSTIISTRPGKIPSVAKGSTSTNPVMGVCWRQDEHPLLNRGPGGEDESGGVAQEVRQDQVRREEQGQDGEELPVASSQPTGRVPSREPAGETSLAPTVCQPEEGRGVSTMSQARRNCAEPKKSRNMAKEPV